MSQARLLSACVRVTNAGRAYLTELKKVMEFKFTGQGNGASVERMQKALVELEHAVEEAEELRELMEGCTIVSNRLYRMADNLNADEQHCCARAGVRSGIVYWVHGTRPSSLGGYLATDVSSTYRQVNGYSPDKRVCQNLPMRFLAPIDEGGAA